MEKWIVYGRQKVSAGANEPKLCAVIKNTITGYYLSAISHHSELSVFCVSMEMTRWNANVKELLCKHVFQFLFSPFNRQWYCYEIFNLITEQLINANNFNYLVSIKRERNWDNVVTYQWNKVVFPRKCSVGSEASSWWQLRNIVASNIHYIYLQRQRNGKLRQ